MWCFKAYLVLCRAFYEIGARGETGKKAGYMEILGWYVNIKLEVQKASLLTYLVIHGILFQ